MTDNAGSSGLQLNQAAADMIVEAIVDNMPRPEIPLCPSPSKSLATVRPLVPSRTMSSRICFSFAIGDGPFVERDAVAVLSQNILQEHWGCKRGFVYICRAHEQMADGTVFGAGAGENIACKLIIYDPILKNLQKCLEIHQKILYI
jgi:hypothetical protein